MDWYNIVHFTVQNGKTALHYAATSGHTSVVQLLSEAGADLNVKDKVPYNICELDCSILLPTLESYLLPLSPAHFLFLYIFLLPLSFPSLLSYPIYFFC